VNPRIVLTILVTLLEEIALAAFVSWGLPMLGVIVPLGGLIAMMAGLVVYGVFTYRFGSRVLRKKPLPGLPDVVGSKGKVVTSLAPEGTVRIGSELWEAKTADRKIKAGEEVIVVERDGLKLIVRKNRPADLKRVDDTY
jgi:membrane-bound ClpP family serine protease